MIEVQRVKYENKYIGVNFIIDSTKFKSDSTKFFIGKTSKYIFTYDKSENKTTVYPINRLKEISFERKNENIKNSINKKFDLLSLWQRIFK